MLILNKTPKARQGPLKAITCKAIIRRATVAVCNATKTNHTPLRNEVLAVWYKAVREESLHSKNDHLWLKTLMHMY